MRRSFQSLWCKRCDATWPNPPTPTIRHHPNRPGHTQTTLERRRKHAELFGRDGQGAAAAGSSNDSSSSSGDSSSADGAATYEELLAALPPPVRRALEQAEALGAAAGPARRGELVPKSCPHCGALAPAEGGAAVLRCGGCGTRWLNVPQDMMQLGTTVMLERQQQRPLGARAPAPPAPGVSETAAVSWGQSKRTAVAVKDAADEGSIFNPDGAANSSSSSSSSLSSPPALPPPAAASPPAAAAAAAAETAAPFGSDPADARAAQLPMWPVVTEGDIYRVITEATGIPTEHLGAHATAQLASLSSSLSLSVVGQRAAVAAAAAAVQVARLGLQPESAARPAASMLLLGPDGVGKSTLARAVGQALLPQESAACLTLAMGDYSERHSAARLVGAPPG